MHTKDCRTIRNMLWILGVSKNGGFTVEQFTLMARMRMMMMMHGWFKGADPYWEKLGSGYRWRQSRPWWKWKELANGWSCAQNGFLPTPMWELVKIRIEDWTWSAWGSLIKDAESHPNSKYWIRKINCSLIKLGVPPQEMLGVPQKKNVKNGSSDDTCWMILASPNFHHLPALWALQTRSMHMTVQRQQQHSTWATAPWSPSLGADRGDKRLGPLMGDIYIYVYVYIYVYIYMYIYIYIYMCIYIHASVSVCIHCLISLNLWI